MSGDERFEREVRLALRGLAAEPAPDRLVQRVASIPASGAPRRPVAFFRVATAVAAAAVLLVAAVAILVSRPGGSTPGGPAAGSAASPAASASTAPAPSGSPGGLVPITTSPAPGGSAGASGAPPASGTPGGSIPSGFQPVSVTFASPDVGWVLGTSSCTTPPCTAAILRTSDAGRTWAAIGAPPVDVVTNGQPASEAGAGVSGLRFADALDGWAYGPDLYATHDGGATWHAVTIPGASGAPVVALEAGDGQVHAVWYGTQDGQAHIASSPVSRDGWALAKVTVPIGAGPVPQSQLVLSGAGGWFLQVDRTVVGGARLVNGAWTSWTPPCASVVGPAVLAASSSTELVAACDVGLWGTPQGEHLYVSHDGGTTFTEAATPLPVQGAVAVTSASRSVIQIAGGAPNGQTTVIVGSFDGGTAWQTVLDLGGVPQVVYLGFTTASQGVVITRSGGGTGNPAYYGALLMTRDGGHTWAPVAFGGS